MSANNDPVERMVLTATIHLLMDHPFIGSLVATMDFEENNDWCETAATDGRKIYWNRKFIESLTKDQIVFLIAHEIFHCVFEHVGRRNGRDPNYWNMAIDYITNDTLIAENIGTMPKVGLHDRRFNSEMTSEEVYNILIKEKPEIRASLDTHLEVQGQSTGDDEGDGSSNNTNGGKENGKSKAPTLSPEEVQQITADIRANVMIAARTVGAGNIPAGVRRLIDEFLNPKMDWRELIATSIKSTINDDYHFDRPSRRSWNEDCEMSIYLPSQKPMETVDIAIAIDTSGSISNQMIKEFLSEVNGIMSVFRDFRIILWTFDGVVHNPKVFNQYNAHELVNYEPKGGGGTLFLENWKFMKNPRKYGFTNNDLPSEIRPHRFIMFTDGMPCDSWGEEGYAETVFIIHGNDKIKPPFGSYAYYK